METRSVKLVSLAQLAPAVKALRFRCLDGQPVGHESGQWVNLHLPLSSETLTRAYSIASAPDLDAPAEFELAVTRVEGGPGSEYLHRLRAGAELEMDGPHGFFTRGDLRAEPALFVGTGTGLSPLRAMIEEELRGPGGPPLTLLFGARHRDDILWEAQLSALAQHHERFRYEVTLSQPDKAWVGRRGYVQEHLADMLQEWPRPHVFICGLTRMVKAVRQALKSDHGYERSHIHSERYD